MAQASWEENDWIGLRLEEERMLAREEGDLVRESTKSSGSSG